MIDDDLILRQQAAEAAAMQPQGRSLFAEPPPEPPPESIVTTPAAMPPPAAAPPVPVTGPGMVVPDGANLGALAGHARRIGDAGQDGLESAKAAAGAMVQAGSDRKDAALAQSEVERQKAEAQAGGYDQQIAQQMAYQQRLAKIQQGEQEAVKAAKDEHAAAIDDAKYGGISRDKRIELQGIVSNPAATPVQQASAKAELEKASNIDPDQFLGTAGRKITAAIAQALGAMGAALTGGPNYAMQMIQQAIQDNIAAQRSGFAKKEREADKAGAAVGEAAQSAEAERTKALRDYGIGIEMAKAKLGKITAGLEGTEAGARAAALAAQLDEETIKNSNAIVQNAIGDYQKSLVAQGGLMSDVAQMREGRSVRAQEAATQGGGHGLQVPGLDGQGISKEAMNEAAQMKGDGEAMLTQLKELRNFVQGPDGVGREVFPTDAAKRAKAMSGTIMLDYGKNLLKLGVLSDGDMEMLRQVIPEDPTSMNQGAVAEKLKNAETFVRVKMHSYLKARGYSMQAGGQPKRASERELAQR